MAGVHWLHDDDQIPEPTNECTCVEPNAVTAVNLAHGLAIESELGVRLLLLVLLQQL